MYLHEFYCIDCGNKSFSIPRSEGRLKKRFHRKKLYCLNCKCLINHVECRDDLDAYEFRTKWLAGYYIQEAAKSKEYCEANECLPFI